MVRLDITEYEARTSRINTLGILVVDLGRASLGHFGHPIEVRKEAVIISVLEAIDQLLKEETPAPKAEVR